MTKQTTTMKIDRKKCLAVIAHYWPEAKLGRETSENLAWLVLISTCFTSAKRNMSETLRQYRQGYEASTSYSGVKSLNNGDDVAHFLDGMSPAEVLAAAERILGFEDGELVTKYAHLNAGQQRMNGGNRIRAALKREDITTDDLH